MIIVRCSVGSVCDDSIGNRVEGRTLNSCVYNSCTMDIKGVLDLYYYRGQLYILSNLFTTEYSNEHSLICAMNMHTVRALALDKPHLQ